MIIPVMPDWAMTTPEVSEALIVECNQAGFDPNLVMAITFVESRFDNQRVRYEPNYSDTWLYHPKEFAEKLFISPVSEIQFQKTSWGVMQVMGAVARERGFKEPLHLLTEADLGFRYGILHLKWLMKKYTAESDIVAAYNKGHVAKTPGGMYYNQKYVDDVYQKLYELRKMK